MTNPTPPHPFAGFVALIAALLAVTALAVDSMLPALPNMGADLGITNPNTTQWIVSAFLFGFGGAQIVAGPLADRFGRRPILLLGLGIYSVASFGAAFTHSFEIMMVARVVQGIGSALPRVLAVSIVRDTYSGRDMSRVMSLAVTVFLAVPILAPSLGQLILQFGPWPWIFLLLGVAAFSVAMWVALALPETLKPENRTGLSVAVIARNFKACVTHRGALGYTLAGASIQGGLFAFINSAQQIFVSLYHVPDLFPALFALIAGAMALASFTNSRLVGRLGTRRMSRVALTGYIVLGAAHALAAWMGAETLWVFAGLQAVLTFFFGLLAPNLGAMAMEPMGQIAGTASAVQGFVTTVTGTAVGFAIGQQFNGTTLPFGVGVLVCGLLAGLSMIMGARGSAPVSQAFR